MESSVDLDTARFYEDNAEFCAQRWELIPAGSGVSRHVVDVFPAGSAVLDIGCGSGRDVVALQAGGFDAFGVEPVAGLRQQCAELHPELAGRVAHGALPGELVLPVEWPAAFDGVICSAVLMHVSKDELADALVAIREKLVVGGRLLVSLPSVRPGIVDGRDGVGRLFTGVRAAELALLAEPLGFSRVGIWENQPDAQSRAEHSWELAVFERE